MENEVVYETGDILFIVESIIKRKDSSLKRRIDTLNLFTSSLPEISMGVPTGVNISKNILDKVSERYVDAVKEKIKDIVSKHLLTELINNIVLSLDKDDKTFNESLKFETDEKLGYIRKTEFAIKVEDTLQNEIVVYNDIPADDRTEKGKKRIDRLIELQKTLDEYNYVDASKVAVEGSQTKK